jgi:hypothetical protein
MTVVRGIYQFLYDFIIGDDWKIAAAVVTALLLGLILLAAGLPTAVGIIVTAVLIGAAFTAALVIDVRDHSGA